MNEYDYLNKYLHHHIIMVIYKRRNVRNCCINLVKWDSMPPVIIFNQFLNGGTVINLNKIFKHWDMTITTFMRWNTCYSADRSDTRWRSQPWHSLVTCITDFQDFTSGTYILFSSLFTWVSKKQYLSVKIFSYKFTIIEFKK